MVFLIFDRVEWWKSRSYDDKPYSLWLQKEHHAEKDKENSISIQPCEGIKIKQNGDVWSHATNQEWCDRKCMNVPKVCVWSLTIIKI